MGFIETFIGVNSRLEVKPEHLKTFIQKEIEENLNLDYQAIPPSHKMNYGELSEDVSAFANSAGGLLLLGIAERKSEGNKPGLPGEITWTSSLTKEGLESALLTRIHPWIDGLIIQPVRDSEAKSVFLFDIPQSMKAPHQAGDGAYYMRYNFQKQRMQHFQIVDLMSRRSMPVLTPVVQVLKVEELGRKIVLQFGLENQGSIIAKHPLLFVTCHDCDVAVDDAPLFGLRIQGEELENGERVIILSLLGAPWTVVHPQMRTYFGTFKISLTNTACWFRMTLGAESAPTQYFLVSAGEKFLRNLGASHSTPVDLGSWREDQMTSETILPYMRQAGMGEDELKAFAQVVVENIKKKIALESKEASA